VFPNQNIVSISHFFPVHLILLDLTTS
jgi:hypothetical protein